jgi:hypothetical protein
MTWTFHSSEPEPTHRTKGEQAASRVKVLEHREADLVRRLVTLKERHAFFPKEVTARQVAELDAKLQQLRAELDAVRGAVQPEIE